MAKSSFGIVCKKTASESWRCLHSGEFSRSRASLGDNRVEASVLSRPTPLHRNTRNCGLQR